MEGPIDAAVPLLPAASLKRSARAFHLSPWNASAVESPEYVTHLQSLSSTTLLSASDSSSSAAPALRVYEKGSFAPLLPGTEPGTFRARYRTIPWEQTGKISTVLTMHQREKEFLAASTSGLVGAFDLRAPDHGPGTLLKGAKQGVPYLCAALAEDGVTLAAGTEVSSSEVSVDIWDLRKPGAPLFVYGDSHSDDITSLSFLPSSLASTSGHPLHLLSASTDGLMSIFDVRKGADEDDVVLNVGNAGASLARAGWGGAGPSLASGAAEAMEVDGEAQIKYGLGSVWAVSDMQTLGIWNSDGFDAFLDPVDTRGPTSLRPPWTSDYVIDANDTRTLSYSETSSDGVTLFCGTQDGSIAIISVPMDMSTSLSEGPTAQSWSLEALLPSSSHRASLGHSDIVRCADWTPSDRLLFTGGEDGNICLWDLSAGSQLFADPTAWAQVQTGGMSGDSPSRSGSKVNSEPLGGAKRFSPYSRK